MAGPPTASFMQATHNFVGAGLPHGAVITLGFTTPVTTETFNGLSAAFVEHWLPRMHNAVTLTTIDYKIGPVSTGPTFPVTINQNGGLSGDAQSANTAYLIRKTVNGLSGRLHGRCFLPGLRENDVTAAGVLNGTLLANFQADLDDYMQALDTLEVLPYVFSTLGGDPRLVARFELDGVVATQRRRMRR